MLVLVETNNQGAITMDSKTSNHTDEGREDLREREAVKKIREIVKEAPVCFFATTVATGDSSGARPMSVRQVDDEGNLWFLSANDSHTNQELALDPTVRLYFQGSDYSDFLQLIGHGTISTDRAKIEELWSGMIQTWFTEGKDDPRITVIKVAPSEGYYWDTKHGTAVAGVKILMGALLRKKMDDSVQGKLEV
jgi:general stress protein 26